MKQKNSIYQHRQNFHLSLVTMNKLIITNSMDNTSECLWLREKYFLVTKNKNISNKYNWPRTINMFSINKYRKRFSNWYWCNCSLVCIKQRWKKKNILKVNKRIVHNSWTRMHFFSLDINYIHLQTLSSVSVWGIKMKEINEWNKSRKFYAKNLNCQIVHYGRRGGGWMWFHFKVFCFPGTIDLAPSMIHPNMPYLFLSSRCARSAFAGCTTWPRAVVSGGGLRAWSMLVWRFFWKLSRKISLPLRRESEVECIILRLLFVSYKWLIQN